MPSTNLEKIYTSPYRYFNIQQLFFYDFFFAQRISYKLSVVKVYDSQSIFLPIFLHNKKKIKTVKQLKVRISQHKGRSFRTNDLLTCPENSKILEHSWNFGHSIHDYNFEILDNPHNFDLRILESLWIRKLKPSLNDRSSSTELSIVCW